jgi:tryptophan-rich sensory protein
VLLTAYNTEQNPGDIQSLATISLTLYWFVISFNLIWFFIFFIQKYLFITFLLNVIQCGIIVGLISFSFRLDRVIGYLILPLLVWSIFSIYLGFGVWLFNRDGVVIDLENANRRRSPRDRERLNGSQNRNYDSIGETL